VAFYSCRVLRQRGWDVFPILFAGLIVGGKVRKSLKLALGLSFLFVMSCAGIKSNPAANSAPETGPYSSKPAAESSSFWISTPENGSLVFIGGAAARTKKDEAIRYALSDAARKVSLYLGLYGTNVSVLDVGTGYLDFNADSVLEIVYDSDYEKYVEQLEFDPETDVLATEDSVYVRARWTPPDSLNTNFVSRRTGRPDWILNPPETIDGYPAAVGRSGAHSRSYSAVIASRENAIAALLRNKHNSLEAGVASVETGSGGSMAAASNREVAEGELSQFYVLEIWIDPADRSVWTLAIAK
jgi:hypothetical protein